MSANVAAARLDALHLLAREIEDFTVNIVFLVLCVMLCCFCVYFDSVRLRIR